MKTRIFLSLCAVAALAAMVTLSSVTGAGLVPFQAQSNAPKVSEAEMQALKAIDALSDPTAKLAAVSEFLKKYPKSTARLQIAERVADEISKTKDTAQAITLA